MIVYSLKCDKGHGFEDWFSSSAAYDRQAGAGELVCPSCGSHRIEKAPMAPAVSGGKSADASGCPMAEPGAAPPCGGACCCHPE